MGRTGADNPCVSTGWAVSRGHMTTFLARWPSTSLVWVLGLLLGLMPQWSMAQAAPKLLVRDATIFSMAPSQKEPFVGYMAVGADGRIVAVGAGEPPVELKAQTV